MTERIGPRVEDDDAGRCSYVDDPTFDPLIPCQRPPVRHLLVATLDGLASMLACLEHLDRARDIAHDTPTGERIEHPVGPACLAAWTRFFPTHCEPSEGPE